MSNVELGRFEKEMNKLKSAESDSDSEFIKKFDWFGRFHGSDLVNGSHWKVS